MQEQLNHIQSFKRFHCVQKEFHYLQWVTHDNKAWNTGSYFWKEHELNEILLKEPTYPHSFAAYHEWEKVAGVGTALFGKETKQRPVLGRNIFDLGLHKPIGLWTWYLMCKASE